MENTGKQISCDRAVYLFIYVCFWFQRHTNDVRLGVVHNPGSIPEKDDKKAHFISRAIQAALATQEPAMAKSFVTKLLKEDNVKALQNGEKSLEDLAVHVSVLMDTLSVQILISSPTAFLCCSSRTVADVASLQNMDFKAYQEALNKLGNAVFHSHRIFCERVLGFKPADRGIVTNGKVLETTTTAVFSKSLTPHQRLSTKQTKPCSCVFTCLLVLKRNLLFNISYRSLGRWGLMKYSFKKTSTCWRNTRWRHQRKKLSRRSTPWNLTTKSKHHDSLGPAAEGWEKLRFRQTNTCFFVRKQKAKKIVSGPVTWSCAFRPCWTPFPSVKPGRVWITMVINTGTISVSKLYRPLLWQKEWVMCDWTELTEFFSFLVVASALWR